MKTDKKRRPSFESSARCSDSNKFELAALAGVSLETVARFERCKHVSLDSDFRIAEAIFRAVAQRNPESVKAVQPVLEAADKLSPQNETLAAFLRRAANTALSLTK